MDYYCYKKNQINSETINLICAEHQNRQKYTKRSVGCLAKAKIRVDPSLIIQRKSNIRADGRERTIYKIDFSNPRCIDVKSYKILPCESGEHNSNCKKTFCNIQIGLT